jgi:hypothetical protein
MKAAAIFKPDSAGKLEVSETAWQDRGRKEWRMLAQYPSGSAAEGFVILAIGGLIVLIAFIVQVAIIRWALRINEMVMYQKQMCGYLYRLCQIQQPQGPEKHEMQ